jgi:hypothetical protein
VTISRLSNVLRPKRGTEGDERSRPVKFFLVYRDLD